MIELTLEQRNAVVQNSETPPRVLDPGTNTGYVLIRAEVYDRIRQVFDLDDDQFARDLLRTSWRSSGETAGMIRRWTSTTKRANILSVYLQYSGKDSRVSPQPDRRTTQAALARRLPGVQRIGIPACDVP